MTSVEKKPASIAGHRAKE